MTWLCILTLVLVTFIGGVFSGVLLGKRTADPEHSSPTYHISIDAVSAKDVPLGSHWYISSRGELPQQPLSFRTSMGYGDFLLKRLRARISAHRKRIRTLDGSKCAFRQDTQCAIRKIRGWGHFKYQIYKSLFQRQNYSQIQSTTENVT